MIIACNNKLYSYHLLLSFVSILYCVTIWEDVLRVRKHRIATTKSVLCHATVRHNVYRMPPNTDRLIWRRFQSHRAVHAHAHDRADGVSHHTPHRSGDRSALQFVWISVLHATTKCGRGGWAANRSV